MIHDILQKFGLSEKEISVYLSCLRLGPSSVRKIAEASNINRGTTYDILRSLKDLGLVNYYHKKIRQYFWAEDPEKIQTVIIKKQQDLDKVKKEIEKVLPELKSIYDKAGDKPVVRYYEGYDGIKHILQDVLDEVEKSQDRQYYVYSSSVRNYLYKRWKGFNRERIKRKIKNKVISIGSGGEFAGLDERKWLTKKEVLGNYSYILIYVGHVALISLNRDNLPVGVIVEDKSTYETHKMIFEFVWKTLDN